MKIGILETGELSEPLRSTYGPYGPMFEALLKRAASDLTVETVSVVNDVWPASVDAPDGWIVTGSRHGVYDDLPFIPKLGAFLRDAYAARIPMVGVCFGHQIMAHALGGRAEKSHKGWGVGAHTYQMRLKPSWMDGIGDSMCVRAMHQDQVVEIPPTAQVLASSEFCTNAAFVYGDPEAPDAMSVQPHPEFDADFMADLIRTRARTLIPAETADTALNSLSEEADTQLWAAWMVRFFRDAVARRSANRSAAE